MTTMSEPVREARDGRDHMTRPSVPALCFPWEIQANTKSWQFLIMNRMHSLTFPASFLLECCLQTSLFFHFNLNLQPPCLKIIAYLYKPNFWPFQIFISLADDGSHFMGMSDLHEFFWCQLTALFLDSLKLPFTCQVLHLKFWLTSWRMWCEFSVLNKRQSFPTHYAIKHFPLL